MDAAEYRRIADQLGAGPVETAHELACARWDLLHRPDRVRGSDPYEAAAQALTAARARPERHQPAVEFAHHAWTPGDLVPAHWGPTRADEWMAEWERLTAAGRR